jgi:hypothetical protein
VLPLENGGKKHPTGKPPFTSGSGKFVCLVRVCWTRTTRMVPTRYEKSVSTARKNEAIQSQVRNGRSRCRLCMVIHGRTNHHQLVRENSLGNLPRFRLPARVSQRNGPTSGSGVMVTLANINNSKQPKRKHRCGDYGRCRPPPQRG